MVSADTPLASCALFKIRAAHRISTELAAKLVCGAEGSTASSASSYVILAEMNPTISAYETAFQATGRLAKAANESLFLLAEFPSAERAYPNIIFT